MVTGQYNELEYRIYSDGDEIYRAGNCISDSQVFFPASQGVGIELMGKYCHKTAKEMAEERAEDFGGVDYCEPEGDE
jgi:hypothetical protein